jgi:CheY-like chemotaxis protein
MSKRILVVEDQPDSRQIIRGMLAPIDYEITEAEPRRGTCAHRKAAARSHFDGYPIADHGRLHGNEPD